METSIDKNMSAAQMVYNQCLGNTSHTGNTENAFQTSEDTFNLETLKLFILGGELFTNATEPGNPL